VQNRSPCELSSSHNLSASPEEEDPLLPPGYTESFDSDPSLEALISSLVPPINVLSEPVPIPTYLGRDLVPTHVLWKPRLHQRENIQTLGRNRFGLEA
jgi:hypothetical protein